jgi:hypothetical protein
MDDEKKPAVQVTLDGHVDKIEMSVSAPMKRAVEEWATDKKLYPHFAKPANPERRNINGQIVVLDAPVANPDFWKFAAARALHGWHEGTEVTESDFDEAIANAISLPIG